LPWEYTGNELHPNQKPVIAITPLIEAYSKPGDIVLVPRDEVLQTGLAVEEGVRIILSAGNATPGQIPRS